MMKVKILTTQYAVNYGAILQALSLSKFLNSKRGIECEILQYLPEGYDRSWKAYLEKTSFRNILRNVFMFFRFDLRRKMKKKRDLFAEFVHEEIPLTKETYDRDTILSNPPQADAFVVGSDQVWNFMLRKDPTYFLDFAKLNTKAKTISYAPSIADPWKIDQYDEIHNLLENVDHISVRELDDVAGCERFTDKKVNWVVDPVFLHTKEEWEEFCVKPKIEEPFILCYFLGCSDLAVNTVNKIKDMTGYPVVYVNLMALDKLKSDYCIRTATPKEFIGYIANATIICTNSFHCSAFANIFHKDYCVIPKSVSNSRMKSLQDKFDISDRFITKERLEKLTLDDLKVDYTQYDINSKECIEDSKDFLMSALNDK